MVIRNYLFHPQSQDALQKLSLNNSTLQSDSCQNHLPASIKWSALSEALPAPTIKWLLISKKANALWLYDCFPSHSQSLFFSSHLSAPLNTNHLGLLRLICLLRISEGRHLQSRIIIILAPLFCKRFFLEKRLVLREHQLFFLLSNANKNCLHLFSAYHLLKLSVLPLLWGVM